MVAVRGKQKRAAAQSFERPQMMSLGQIEEEIKALLEHDQNLRDRPQCGRNRCDGLPHIGFPYPHEPKRPAGRTPMVEARFIDPSYTSRKHLFYLSDRLTNATRDVERGTSRYLTVSMPPRMGKSQMTSVFLPIWLLHKHPEWKIGLVSHSPTLATNWGRQVRRLIEQMPDELGIYLAPDAGAVADWQTTKGGGVISRSAPGQKITGFGFDVLILDDVVADYATAHQEVARDSLWEWWKGDAFPRLEHPALVVVVGTRWHEDDFIGRLLSDEHEGDPDIWEVISFPALAEEKDVLGRAPGEPLISPLGDETAEEALERWATIKEAVGSYAWASLYQQRPAPAEGAIFDTGHWRYWTTDPDRARDDGSVVLLDPDTLSSGRWLDSWDFTFKGSDTADFVVGQRWVRQGPHRFLMHQWRGRWTFTEQIQRMRQSAVRDNHAVSPFGQYVHERLIEAAANGEAIIDTLREEIAGIKPVNPRTSKEARARAITPEVESGHVYLPHPADPGNEWVQDLLAELREFPHGKNDDQVDALTQGLLGLREEGKGKITVPGGVQPRAPQGITGQFGGYFGGTGSKVSAAQSMMRRT